MQDGLPLDLQSPSAVGIVVPDGLIEKDHTLKTLYPNIDLIKAITCAEFSRLCYRRNYRETVTPDVVTFQQREKSKIAEQFSYQAKVFLSNDQQCVIFHNDRDIIVAFEGSRALRADHYWRNLASYFFAWFTPAPDVITQAAREVTGDKEAVAKVHFGFDNALNGQVTSPNTSEHGKPMWDGIKRYCQELHAKNPKLKLYFTGHSAGGAIATIATARALNDMPEVEIGGLYTFGQPRVGGKYFKAGLEHLLGRDKAEGREKIFRFEQYADPMAALPPYHADDYVPVGQWIPMDVKGHLLKRGGFKDYQPTLSEANPALQSKIEGEYAHAHPLLKRLGGTLSAAANGSAAMGTHLLKRYVFPADLIEQIPYDLKRSYSSLQNLFSPQNYTVAHKIKTYSAAIQNHMDTHRLLGRKPDVQFLHGQLMWAINEAADVMQLSPLPATLSEGLRVAVNSSQFSINTLMRECEDLMKQHLPDKVLAPIPEIRRPLHPLDFLMPFWYNPLTQETRDAQAIQGTLTHALTDPGGKLNRSIRYVKHGEVVNRLEKVRDQFQAIKNAMTDEDKRIMATGREDVRSLPYLVDSVVELCEQMETAMHKQHPRSAGMSR